MVTLRKNSLKYKDENGVMQDSGVLFASDEEKNYATKEEVQRLSEEIVDQQNDINDLKNKQITTEDIAELGFWTEDDGKNYVDSEIVDLKAQGVQQTPLFANSVEECTDTTKVYVLPDGYIYAEMEVTEEGDTVPNFTNIKDQCYFKYGYKYSKSGGGYSAQSYSVSVLVVPVPSGTTSCTIYLQGVTAHPDNSAMYAGIGTESFAYADTVFSTNWGSSCLVSEGKYTIPVTKTASSTHVLMHLVGSSASDFTNAIVTVNEPIEYKTETETITVKKFANTGHAFVPADYEDRIIELEEKAEDIAENTERIKLLEEKVSDVKTEIDLADYLNSAHCPVQLNANAETDSDFNLHTYKDFGKGFDSYFDDLITRYPNYLIREHLGKDASGTLDMYRYVLGKRYYSAWCKENYPRMYAWKNNNVIVYSVSVAPRLGDNMYSTPYIGTVYSTVTSVSATKRSRTVNGIEFVRYEDGDVEPTVCYTPSYNPNNLLVNANGNTVATISTINKDVLADLNSVNYIRYPFGDLKKDKTKPIHMTIIANEHGGYTEPAPPTIVTARLIRDLCNGQLSENPIYRFIRDNVQLTVIAPVNPHGLNRFVVGTGLGYYNANGVNINRNYDTVGWDVYPTTHPDEAETMGEYAGSENETQYVMNTMVDSQAKVAMSIHTISCRATQHIDDCMYQGQNPNGGFTQSKIDEISEDMKASYNLNFVAYNPLECPPETTSKSPSFITQCGAYGGIVEFACHNPLSTDEEVSTDASMFTDVVMEQNYSLLLKFIAMWLSDYLDNI